jgi:dTMP kinase
MFITFEGIDGCGKTTQIEWLAARLSQSEYSHLRTREPGGTALAEAIRHYLLHSRDKLNERAELLLFGASRAAHAAQIIRPALERGDIVLCDRFSDSSVAYQGGGLELDTSFVHAMNAFATENLQPDITFFLDIEPRLALARRATETADRIEARGLEFQQRVRNAFLEIARAEPQRVCVLDGAQSRERLHAQILEMLRRRGLKFNA